MSLNHGALEISIAPISLSKSSFLLLSTTGKMNEQYEYSHIKPLESGATSVPEVDSGKVTLNIREVEDIPGDTPSPEELSTISPFPGSMEQPASGVEVVHQLECYDVVVAGVSFTPIRFD